MTDLADRVERLTEPSREIDVRIYLHVYGDIIYGFKGPMNMVTAGTLSGYHATFSNVIDADDAIPDDVVPRYTTSIDAAMTLVTEGGMFVVMRAVDGLVYASVDGGRPVQNDTPAIALTAAALRARKDG